MIPDGPRGNAFDADFTDKAHIEAFAAALRAEDDGSDFDESGAASPGIPPTPGYAKVRKISAMSDFAPIAQRVKKSNMRVKSEPQREFIFQLVRWPLLFLLGIVIFGQFGLYVVIRQVVNTMEWLFAWRGRKGVLRQRLRNAKSYQEWKEAALTMDEYLGFHEWKREEEDPYYDYLLVKKVRRSLRTLREKNDARSLLGVLDLCLRANFAGTESPRLYSETFYGTKNAIESYISEVELALDYVRRTPTISLDEKRRFFKNANRNVGSSALCLSGGATFGFYHIGVVKALLDANMLPRVISGTSCGSLVAALICTRTDDELRKLLVPGLAPVITACSEGFFTWFPRLLKTGARFDTLKWADETSFFSRGSLTFKEAYELTGRVLNVSVIPFDRHSPTKLLNYLTAPDCVIWSAVLASAAVPGILNPVVLMAKTKNGTIVPWSWGRRFRDGSLRVDVPLQSLNLLFNVNHPIVSQVNPHVHLFFFASRGSPGKPVAHRKGKGWRGGFLLSAAEQFLKHELTKNFKVIRDLELMPQLLGQDWSSVFLQRFGGSVTILPRTRLMDWVHILSDPSVQDLGMKIRSGEYATWPKLHMIENRFRIERKILRGRLAVRRATQTKGDKSLVEGASAANATLRPMLSSSALNRADTSSGAGQTDSGIKFPNLASEQLPVESDAEEGFAAGSDRFFKRPHGRHHHRTASHGYFQRQHSKETLPQIVVQAETPAWERRRSGSFATISSPVRRRRWGSVYNAFGTSPPGEPATAPLPPPKDSTIQSLSPTSTAEQPRPNSFLARLRSTSFTALTSPFARRNRDADARSLTSAQLEDERWSSDSSSEDELIWNDGQLTAIPNMALDVGEEENQAWGIRRLRLDRNPREDEDADLDGKANESP